MGIIWKAAILALIKNLPLGQRLLISCGFLLLRAFVLCCCDRTLIEKVDWVFAFDLELGRQVGRFVSAGRWWILDKEKPMKKVTGLRIIRVDGLYFAEVVLRACKVCE